MKRILLTGMSGVGKSTVVAELVRRGFRAVDTDDDSWREWVEVDGEPDWVWREDRMTRLLAVEDAEVLFVGGTSWNQGKFYDRFDEVVLLTAPTPVLVERLATRTNNPYGKSAEELARVLDHIATVEPRLRRRATAEIDTSTPLDRVVEEVLRLARDRA